MIRVRPVRMADHGEMLALAREAGIGMTSLPQDSVVLEQKIATAEASFAGKPARPKEEAFLFVLEDTESKQPGGSAGIKAHVGLNRPFYSYKLSTIVQASRSLDIYSHQHVLHMVNDYTGASELGSLFLLPGFRRDGIGKFLSRCRHLMLAQFPDIFADIVISEIRGVQDDGMESPFYNHLARHFFQMDFKRADFIHATQGGQFIADLMPKYPIYVALLHPEAQAVIGKPLAASRPAMELLQREGFRHQDYVDVFDAGPTLEVERSAIQTVRDSILARVSGVAPLSGGKPAMIASTRLADFTVVMDALAPSSGDAVTLSPEAAQAMNAAQGDTVRWAWL